MEACPWKHVCLKKAVAFQTLRKKRAKRPDKACKLVSTEMWMFIVSDAEAASIRQAYLQYGEDGAVLELRRLFAGLEDNEGTRVSAVTIAGWTDPVLPGSAKARTTVRR